MIVVDILTILMAIALIGLFSVHRERVKGTVHYTSAYKFLYSLIILFTILIILTILFGY